MTNTKAIWDREEREHLLETLKNQGHPEVIMTGDGFFYDNDVGCVVPDFIALHLMITATYGDHSKSDAEKLRFLKEILSLKE